MHAHLFIFVYNLIMKLLCPVCKRPLVREGRSYCCEMRHTFDLAKSGYLNVYRSNKADHGDNKQMVKARTLFLESSAYAFLAKRLCELLKDRHSVVDLACGEGYYTNQLQNPDIVGVDLSKDALNHAAKLNKQITWLLASIFDLPLEDGCTDGVLTCFAPFAKDEISRILKKNGIFVFVTPGPKHLYEMKEVLYETPYLNSEKELDTSLTLIHQETISAPFICDTEHLLALFAMTPYAYRTGKEGIAKLSALSSLQMTAEFTIRVYQK